MLLLLFSEARLSDCSRKFVHSCNSSNQGISTRSSSSDRCETGHHDEAIVLAVGRCVADSVIVACDLLIVALEGSGSPPLDLAAAKRGLYITKSSWA